MNWAKTVFSEAYPELWLFAMGAMFIGVVLAFPEGLAGLYKVYVEPHILKLVGAKNKNVTQVNPAE